MQQLILYTKYGYMNNGKMHQRNRFFFVFRFFVVFWIERLHFRQVITDEGMITEILRPNRGKAASVYMWTNL